MPNLPSPPGSSLYRGPAWQSQSHALDQLALELQQAQQNLFRQQVTKLAADMDFLRNEVAQMQLTFDNDKTAIAAMLESRCRDLHMRVGELNETIGRHERSHEASKVQIDRLCSLCTILERGNINLSSLQENLEALANHRNTTEAKYVSLDERMANLADKVTFLADRHQQHAGAFEEHKNAHAQLISDLQQYKAHHSSLVSRLGNAEKTMTESLDSHAQQLSNVHTKMSHCLGRVSEEQSGRDAAHARIEELRKAHESHGAFHHERAQKLEERLSSMESLLGATTNEHAKRLQATHQNVQEFYDRMNTNHQHHLSRSQVLEQKLKQMEAAVAENVGRSEIDFLRRKILDIDGHLSGEQGARESVINALDARVQSIESTFVQALGTRDKQYRDLAASHCQLQEMCSSLHDFKKACDTQQAVLGMRIEGMEKMIQGSFADHDRELQASRKQVQHIAARLSEEKDARELNRGALKERLSSLEACLGASSTKYQKDLEQIPECGELRVASQWSGDKTGSPSLGGVGNGSFPSDASSWDRDFFRQVAALVIKDDSVDTRTFLHNGRLLSAKPKMPRVTSLPALTPGL